MRRRSNASSAATRPSSNPDSRSSSRAHRADSTCRSPPRSPPASRIVEVVFICVGTPPRETGEANLVAVEDAARQVARAATPVSSSSRSRRCRREPPIGSDARSRWSDRCAVRDRGRLEPGVPPRRHRDRGLAPTGPDPDRSRLSTRLRGDAPHLSGVDRRQGSPVIETDIRTAELAKHASNAFLALKISYANGLARSASGRAPTSSRSQRSWDPIRGSDGRSSTPAWGTGGTASRRTSTRSNDSRTTWHTSSR